jgi:hypothetical protein
MPPDKIENRQRRTWGIRFLLQVGGGGFPKVLEQGLPRAICDYNGEMYY